MTDTQILTLAIAVVVPLSLLIYSNSRVTDVKETLRAEMKALEKRIDNGFDHLELLLKLHEAEHHK